MGVGSTMTLNRVERLQLKPLGGGGDVGQGLVSSQERRALKLGREANCHFQHSPSSSLFPPTPSSPQLPAPRAPIMCGWDTRAKTRMTAAQFCCRKTRI